MSIVSVAVGCNLIYSIILAFIYFSKTRMKNAENSIYKVIIISNILGLIIELLCYFFVKNRDIFPVVNIIVNKCFLIYLLLWEVAFTTYIVTISFPKLSNLKKKEKNKGMTLMTLFFIISLVITIVLPLYYYSNDLYVYSYGPSTDFLTIAGALFLVVDIICVIFNIKKMRLKKYLPVIALVVIMSFVVGLRTINPGLNFITTAFSIVTVLMYFTIENPDLQMIDELVKNRALVESTMEDKSIFLFKMSQEIKQPVKKISTCVKEYKDRDLTKEELDENYQNIEKNVNDLVFMINDILNVSNMDINKIKIIDTSYNTKNFFDNLKLLTENKLKDKNINLNYTLTKSIPEVLFGDYIKLKQALVAILNNAVQNTEKGYIDFEINCITRYDAVRLIITIADTGSGMNLEKINDILSKVSDFTEEEFQKVNELDVDLRLAVKLIRMMGGNINIKSSSANGTEVTVVIDQKKIENKEQFNINKYTNFLSNKRVLIVDDDIDEIRKLVNDFAKEDTEVNFAMFGKDCVDRIMTGEKYDLIVMDDEMVPDNALPTFQKLKEIKKFNIPVVVMLEKEKEFIKEHYINDGFSDYLLKNTMDKEIKRIIDKYL